MIKKKQIFSLIYGRCSHSFVCSSIIITVFLYPAHFLLFQTCTFVFFKKFTSLYLTLIIYSVTYPDPYLSFSYYASPFSHQLLLIHTHICMQLLVFTYPLLLPPLVYVPSFFFLMSLFYEDGCASLGTGTKKKYNNLYIYILISSYLLI